MDIREFVDIMNEQMNKYLSIWSVTLCCQYIDQKYFNNLSLKSSDLDK
jgi:hypothetical protein